MIKKLYIYLEDPLAKHLNTDPDPPTISQFLRFTKLAGLRLQLQQFSDRALWYMGGKLVNFFPE